jgi:hypothetical protein
MALKLKQTAPVEVKPKYTAHRALAGAVACSTPARGNCGDAAGHQKQGAGWFWDRHEGEALVLAVPALEEYVGRACGDIEAYRAGVDREGCAGGSMLDCELEVQAAVNEVGCAAKGECLRRFDADDSKLAM